MQYNLIPITRATLEALKGELRQLMAEKVELAAEARHSYETGGYWHDNFAWEEARRQQGMIGGRIVDLRALFRSYQLIENMEIDAATVGIGTVVRLRGGEGEFCLTVLGPYDVNSGENVVSYEAPLVAVLRGARVGEERQFDGDELKVLEITKWEPKEGIQDVAAETRCQVQ